MNKILISTEEELFLKLGKTKEHWESLTKDSPRENFYILTEFLFSHNNHYTQEIFEKALSFLKEPFIRNEFFISISKKQKLNHSFSEMFQDEISWNLQKKYHFQETHQKFYNKYTTTFVFKDGRISRNIIEKQIPLNDLYEIYNNYRDFFFLYNDHFEVPEELSLKILMDPSASEQEKRNICSFQKFSEKTIKNNWRYFYPHELLFNPLLEEKMFPIILKRMSLSKKFS